MTLASNEVHVWVAETKDLPHILKRRWEDVLNADERERHARIKQRSDGDAYLTAHALLRGALSLYADLSPEEWAFSSNARAKPHITNPNMSDVRFSLSHTRGLAACAVASVDVGIDCEAVEDCGEMLTHAVLSDAELCALEHLPAARRAREFLLMWVLKEAYFKARGVGLPETMAEIRAVTFARTSSGIGAVLEKPAASDTRNWRFMTLDLLPMHVIGVAVAASRGLDLAIRSKVVDRSSLPDRRAFALG